MWKKKDMVNTRNGGKKNNKEISKGKKNAGYKKI